MEKEIWKPIKGYEEVYEVSNFGRVRSLDRFVKNPHGGKSKLKGKLLSISTSNGYRSVRLYSNGKGDTKMIHRLIALAFIPNHENKRTVNHIDGNKLNNDLSNLEWATDKENLKHAWDNGLCENVRKVAKETRAKRKDLDLYNAVRVKDLEGNVFESIADAAKHHRINYTTLVARLRGRLKNNTGISFVD